MKSLFHLTLATLLLLSSLLLAQEEKVPPRTLRLLAVGDAPPFRQEIRDGVRYELEPPEGSVPPNRIELRYGEEKGEEMRFVLKRTTSRVELPGAALALRIYAGEDLWHTLNLPEGGDYLAVLVRDPEKQSWVSALSLLVPDGGARFGDGDVRFINLTGVPIGFEMSEGARFPVASGKVVTQRLGEHPGAPTKAFYQDPKRGWRRFWSSALVQNRGERSTVLSYRADGESPRRPVKLIALREKVNPLKPKPPEPPQ